jgi:hypothetical protein
MFCLICVKGGGACLMCIRVLKTVYGLLRCPWFLQFAVFQGVCGCVRVGNTSLGF